MRSIAFTVSLKESGWRSLPAPSLLGALFLSYLTTHVGWFEETIPAFRQS